MASTNRVTTKWLGDMAFESNNPSGLKFKIDASPEDGGKGEGLRPKALMLSSLAGCSGLDVASLIRKMKLDVSGFHIETNADLSDTHPQTYTKVSLEFHFFGKNLNRAKLEKAVNLSAEKYCGVMAMFREFAQMGVICHFHEE
ncbi:OsmC family protein [Robiginitalea sp. IMCC44478]|uniref:OsmC family protein n=1 Tax=Robiginitalea sp. IMCC44478 TaxID=3459122 RepID=UPI004040F654